MSNHLNIDTPQIGSSGVLVIFDTNALSSAVTYGLKELPSHKAIDNAHYQFFFPKAVIEELENTPEGSLDQWRAESALSYCKAYENSMKGMSVLFTAEDEKKAEEFFHPVLGMLKKFKNDMRILTTAIYSQYVHEKRSTVLLVTDDRNLSLLALMAGINTSRSGECQIVIPKLAAARNELEDKVIVQNYHVDTIRFLSKKDAAKIMAIPQESFSQKQKCPNFLDSKIEAGKMLFFTLPLVQFLDSTKFDPNQSHQSYAATHAALKSVKKAFHEDETLAALTVNLFLKSFFGLEFQFLSQLVCGQNVVNYGKDALVGMSEPELSMDPVDEKVPLPAVTASLRNCYGGVISGKLLFVADDGNFEQTTRTWLSSVLAKQTQIFPLHTPMLFMDDDIRDACDDICDIYDDICDADDKFTAEYPPVVMGTLSLNFDHTKYPHAARHIDALDKIRLRWVMQSYRRFIENGFYFVTRDFCLYYCYFIYKKKLNIVNPGIDKRPYMCCANYNRPHAYDAKIESNTRGVCRSDKCFYQHQCLICGKHGAMGHHGFFNCPQFNEIVDVFIGMLSQSTRNQTKPNHELRSVSMNPSILPQPVNVPPPTIAPQKKIIQSDTSNQESKCGQKVKNQTERKVDVQKAKEKGKPKENGWKLVR